MAVMFAGSFMNFVLAFVLFSILVAAMGFNTTTILHVVPNFPAEASGLAPGDKITSLNGSRIFLWEDINLTLDTSYGRPIEVGFIREGQQHSVSVTPVKTRIGNDDNYRYVYRIGLASERRVGLFDDRAPGVYRASISEALTVGFMRIGFYIRLIVTTLLHLVTGQVSLEQLGFAGPVGIVVMIGGEYQAAVAVAAETQLNTIFLVTISMLNFAALISANLGVFNLLPIPGLDGGRIFFLALEGVRRKPIPPEREGMVHLAGFALLLLFAVFITYHDIINLIQN